MDGEAVVRRDENTGSTDEFLGRYEVDDSDVYMTNPVGGPIEEQESLSAGERGPTLLEDQTFRRKVSYT
jgi:catalase